MLFHHIGIIGKYHSSDAQIGIARLIHWLTQHHLAFSLDDNTMPENLKSHPQARAISAWDDEVDLCIVVGGDGTFLHAGRLLLQKEIPLLGINVGRLGFLADLPLEGLESALEAMILRGEFRREVRHTLDVAVQRQSGPAVHFTAINDAVIHKRHMARMIELQVFAQEQPLAHYRADGLIISTPTGSTAYALAAGGPIIEPDLAAVVVVPICPHTLMQRPLVLSAEVGLRVCFDPERFYDVQLTIDGQEECILAPEDEIYIGAAKALTVIHPSNYHFQHRLREKLNWGGASRGGSPC